MKELYMKTLILSAAVAVMLAATPAFADDTDDFLQKAGVANQFEIVSSQVALERSQAQDVRDFAQRMIDDHTKAGNDMKAAVEAAGLDTAKIPTALDDDHAKTIEDLRKADADDFNDDYINAQVKAHKDAVDLFGDYADDGDTPAIKSFAASTLPTLKEHKDMVEKLDDAH
jgi:putative membrane protein